MHKDKYKNYRICRRSILIKVLKYKEKCIEIGSSVPTKLLNNNNRTSALEQTAA